jgi:hypothetical protein
MNTVEDYKNYRLVAQPNELNGRWSVRVLIECQPNTRGTAAGEYGSFESYASKDEATEASLTFGRFIVDGLERGAGSR